MRGLPAPCEKAKNKIEIKRSSVFFSLFGFCFVDLTVGLAINKAVLMASKIAVSLPR